MYQEHHIDICIALFSYLAINLLFAQCHAINYVYGSCSQKSQNN